jgi:hypothetical protein
MENGILSAKIRFTVVRRIRDARMALAMGIRYPVVAAIRLWLTHPHPKRVRLPDWTRTRTGSCHLLRVRL